MPIYEYQCTHCGEKFEIRQSFGEDSSHLNCPKCHAENPRRLLSSFFTQSSAMSELSDTSCPTCSTGVCGLPPMG
ncbi:MAG: zinc ribbon domain-containing protein [Dehalococcoidia bacterium]|nr:MAG: zinc ribbon domain-containing protein [Dehalococcoidia bacterium]